MQFSQMVIRAVAAAEEPAEGGHGGLGSHVFFSIGPLEISEHVFSAWIVMAVLVILSMLATRNMQMVPRGLQNVMEAVIEALQGIIDANAGPRGKLFAPVVMTAFLFILFANWIGTMPFFGNMVGFKSPNSNLSITAAMAVVVFFLCQYFAIKTNGIGGYLKEFVVPNPLHILTELSRPLSLSLRLFGNIYAGGVLVHTMLSIAPIVTFVFLGLELFVGIVQALIFTMLSLVFLATAVTPHHGHDDAHGDAHAVAHH